MHHHALGGIGGDLYWVMANSSKIDRAQQKAAGQRNRARGMKARRAKTGAQKRRTARANKAAAGRTAPKTPPASPQ